MRKNQLKAGDGVWFRPIHAQHEQRLAFVVGFDPKWPNHVVLKVDDDLTFMGSELWVPLDRLVAKVGPDGKDVAI
jgi:hypothetical protein